MRIDRRRFLISLFGTAALPSLRASAASHSQPKPALASDPRRPQYHLLPAANWMNDPNGPIYWNGQYHMFYQFNPDGAYWGNMHWGHAVSPDMVRWRHLPVALSPTPGGPDAAGCFTGTAVVQDGRVTILYTGVRNASLDDATIKDSTPPLRESQCLAVAEDSDLSAWRKAPVPVIGAPPSKFRVNGFRDPSPWRQGGWWYTVIASGIAKEGGAVLLYRSRDLRKWEFLQVLSRREANVPGGPDSFGPSEVWECPEFFPLGDRHVLIFSTGGKTFWQSGTLNQSSMTFHVEQAGIMDYGSFYAAKTQLDEAGNRIVWGWIPETRPLSDYEAAGWAGLMSLPRVLSIAPDGKLRVRVEGGVYQLRNRRQFLNVHADEETIQRQIEELRLAECCGEIRCAARMLTTPFTFALCGEFAGESPWMMIRFDPQHPDQVLVEGRPLPLSLERGANLEIEAHVDASVIELLVNGQVAWTKRFYPSGNSPRDLRLRWTGSTTTIVSLELWQYFPISADRLTT